MIRHPSRHRCAAVLAVLPGLAAAPLETVSDAPVPLAVRDGRCTFVLPPGNQADKYMLIVGVLSRGPESHRVSVRTDANNDPVSLPLADDDPGPAWRKYTTELASRQDRARKDRRASEDYPPAPDPPRRRDFFVFSDPASYAPVRGDLRGVGRHCLVYVDRDCPEPAALQPAVDEVIRVFDGAIFPVARQELGRCRDVDRDGRFTVLFSGRLARVSGSKGTLSGFVLGSDFYHDLQMPFGNRCDMLYLNTDLRPGPFLRTLIAHEYTHAIVISEHLFGDYLSGVRRTEEESWINEGLAHLAEERHGFGWDNLDYRVSAFLAAPWRYPLVVPDYYGSGLWRDPGCRGATYLFLHTCACAEAGLAAKLVQSNLSGVANLEAATRESLAALFRQWTIAVARGKIPGGHDLFRPLGSRRLCGVRQEPLPLTGGTLQLDIASTSAAYLLLHSPGTSQARVTVEAEAGADLQVTLLPLSPTMPRISLQAERIRVNTYRLTVSAHDAGVTLEQATWEERSSADQVAGHNDPSRPRSETPVVNWFRGPDLSAGETRRSSAIELPINGRAVFCVSGRDSTGRWVAGWAETVPR